MKVLSSMRYLGRSVLGELQQMATVYTADLYNGSRQQKLNRLLCIQHISSLYHRGILT